MDRLMRQFPETPLRVPLERRDVINGLMRATVGVLLTLVFVVIALFNAWTVINYFRKRSHISAIPLIAGVAGASATQLSPQVHDLWWLPLVLDYGSIPMLVYFFFNRLIASRHEDT